LAAPSVSGQPRRVPRHCQLGLVADPPSSAREEIMPIGIIRDVLLRCTVIDYGVLLVWFLVFVFAHDRLQRLHGKWFRLSREQFDAIHYAGMSVFKIGILLFNLVPLVGLSMLE
jgi:hypothetical protein